MAASHFKDFLKVAREYCEFSERESGVTEDDLWKVRDLLLKLISLIPTIEESSGGEDSSIPRYDINDYNRVAKRFIDFPINFYRMVFDPLDVASTEAPVIGSLADDLADIYRDLSEGLDYANRGQIENACFQWRYLYKTHWARHATSALNAIESYRNSIEE